MRNGEKTLSDIAMKEAESVDDTANTAHLKVRKDYGDASDGNVSPRLIPETSIPVAGRQDGNLDGGTKDEDREVIIEEDAIKPLMYRISQRPPPHLLLLFAFQQSLVSISAPMTTTLIVAEVVCGQRDEELKIQILSASFLMVGVSTFVMSTFGVRLPIFQGPAAVYLIPMIAMSAMPQWKCPETFTSVNPVDNTTVTMVTTDNGTITSREYVLSKIAELSGSLMLAGGLHFIIGVTGLIGVLLRFIGPLTVVPAIALIGIYLCKIVLKFCETNWPVAILTAVVTLVLSFYLAKRLTPIPFWSPRRGFHILWFPFHQAFSVLLSILFGWILSAILTMAGVLTDDRTSRQYYARTDATSHMIAETDWFIFPYPGKFGPLSFSAAGFSSFFVATVMSVLDSIGDYSTCARAVRVPPPPFYAFNRGIGAEGLMSMLSGAMGCCHATLSYGGNIGAIKLTGVASRSVFQCCALIYILFAILGKIGAIFMTIPYSVLGGTSFVINGMFLGLVLSNLQFVDLNSSRNLAIIGTAIMLGMMLPDWVTSNPDGIDTGNVHMNNLFQVLLSNPAFVGGCLACFLDNTIPGTLRERGLLNQLNELNDEESKLLAKSYEDGEEVYQLPFIPEVFSKSKLAKYIPIFKYTGK